MHLTILSTDETSASQSGPSQSERDRGITDRLCQLCMYTVFIGRYRRGWEQEAVTLLGENALSNRFDLGPALPNPKPIRWSNSERLGAIRCGWISVYTRPERGSSG